MLDGTPSLIAEDQVFIALDLALAVEDAGGTVVGPAASVENALALIKSKPVAAAILDVNLTDGDITPVAMCLLEAGIPIIIQSGVGAPTALSAQYPDLVVYIKPYKISELMVKLENLLQFKSSSPSTSRV